MAFFRLKWQSTDFLGEVSLTEHTWASHGCHLNDMNELISLQVGCLGEGVRQQEVGGATDSERRALWLVAGGKAERG